MTKTQNERIQLFAALAAPFPEEAVERTDGRVTGRGYSTTGIKYQYVVDRLNAVLGVGGFRTERTITVKPITTAKGRPGFEAIAEVKLELGEWIDGRFLVYAQAWGDGGHVAMGEADSRKGSFTNAFKKAAAFMGPGRDAYRGTIDDDHVPSDDIVATTSAAVATAPLSRAAPPADSVPANDQQDDGPAVGPPISPAHPVRSRLTSRQFAALRSLSAKAGYEPSSFKTEMRRRFGVEPGYLSARDASIVIGEMLAGMNGHGAREVG